MGNKKEYNNGVLVGNNGLRFVVETEARQIGKSQKDKKRRAIFKCECGNEFETIISSVVSGNTKSCGCKAHKHNKHGFSKTKAYRSWTNIKKCCYNKQSKEYPSVGGNGIVLSDEFLNSPDVFCEYVLSLENAEKDGYKLFRIDNLKNYERGNLAWIHKNAKNKRKRKVYELGHMFGNIEFISEDGYSGLDRIATFKCSCGNYFTAPIHYVKSGNTRSCGCLVKNPPKRVKYYGHPVYYQWYDIKGRCFNPNYSNYVNYGGRGIKMSDEFLNDRDLFIEYAMSLKNYGKKGYTLDRINNDGDYCRGNLRWTSRTTQCLNQRKRDNDSGYTGVYQEKRCNNKWKALLHIHHKRINIGFSFNSPEEAAIARDNYIIKHNLPHRLSGLPLD